MSFRPASILPLLAALGLLLGSLSATVWQPGCPVRAWTGLKCPGCGAGRAMEAILRGDAAGAWYWNALLLSLIALLVIAGFRKPWSWRGWLALGAAGLAFAVVRNLPFYLLY
jgi:hypothetical protein